MFFISVRIKFWNIFGIEQFCNSILNAILKWQSKISCCIKQLLTTFNFINEMSFSQAKTSHQKIVDGFKWKIIMVVGKIKKKGLLVSCFLYYFLWVVALSRKQGCVVLTKIQLVPVLSWWCLAVLNNIILWISEHWYSKEVKDLCEYLVLSKRSYCWKFKGWIQNCSYLLLFKYC